MGIREALLAEFDHEMGTTRKLLDRIPDSQLTWKPHERSMSLGGLATHLANLPYWTERILKESSFDLATAPPPLEQKASRSEVLGHFDRTRDAARKAMDISDAEWAAPWTLRNGDYEMFTMPRAAAFRSFVMNHSVHHRGQLSVYLRLLNVPLPAIYGPSADEA